MVNSKTLTAKDPIKRWILIGIPVIFIVGALMHFIYEWSGHLTIVGIIAPVNESTWEHLKLSFWPLFVWWLAGYFIFGKGTKTSAAQWFVSCAVALWVCSLFIVTFFYTYTGASGIDSLFLDILSLLLGLAVGQGVALHVFKYARFKLSSVYVAMAMLILLAAAFIVFTFSPPHIPLFKDAPTGNYGI
jgi:hypothetical protein